MHKNNYQMLRKIKRLGILNARENINAELEKLGCRPVFYNDNTKRYEVLFCVCHTTGQPEEFTKQEEETFKKIKAICDRAKIYLSSLVFYDDIPFED